MPAGGEIGLTGLDLVVGAWRMTLRPDVGGAIARLDHQNTPVLRTMAEGQGDPLASANFPLVPYANRIAQGRFAAQGRAYHLPRNFGDHPHTLHGVGWQSVWEVSHRADYRVILSHRHDGGGEWPWRYRATQSFQLTEQGLEVVLDLTNADSEPMPAGLGFHPYFACGPKTRLRFAAAGLWQANATMLPTVRAPVDSLGDWAVGAVVRGETLIDNAYDGWVGSALVDHGEGRAYRLAAVGASWLHLYRPAGESGFFCIEPVSHEPDAINRDGMPLLAPGETRRLEMRIAPA